jgi:hypothetical protein
VQVTEFEPKQCSSSILIRGADDASGKEKTSSVTTCTPVMISDGKHRGRLTASTSYAPSHSARTSAFVAPQSQKARPVGVVFYPFHSPALSFLAACVVHLMTGGAIFVLPTNQPGNCKTQIFNRHETRHCTHCKIMGSANFVLPTGQNGNYQPATNMSLHV